MDPQDAPVQFLSLICQTKETKKGKKKKAKDHK